MVSSPPFIPRDDPASVAAGGATLAWRRWAAVTDHEFKGFRHGIRMPGTTDCRHLLRRPSEVKIN
jgi:hypothetical protein